MPKPPPDVPLCPRDLEDVQASGLSDETILSEGWYTLTDNPGRMSQLMNRHESADVCAGGGMVIRYRDIQGKVNCYVRVKPHRPRKGKDGKLIKYESPAGVPPRPYFPAIALDRIRDASQPLFWVEGEKKALALAQLGYAVVGLGGVWSWKAKDNEALLPEILSVPLGRPHFIVWDFDTKPDTRANTGLAARRLARPLRDAGASEVYEVRLPPGPDGAKQGVDDYLVAQGEDGPAAFQALADAAKPVPGLDDVPGLDVPEGRTDTANALRLVGLHGSDVRWVGSWDKWLVFDGIRWRADDRLLIDGKAKDVVGYMWDVIQRYRQELKR